MLIKILISSLLAILGIFGGYVFLKNIEVVSLNKKVKDGEDAILAYEQLLKIVPSDAVNEERKERANEKINKIINNGNSIIDNTYKL